MPLKYSPLPQNVSYNQRKKAKPRFRGVLARLGGRLSRLATPLSRPRCRLSGAAFYLLAFRPLELGCEKKQALQRFTLVTSRVHIDDFCYRLLPLLPLSMMVALFSPQFLAISIQLKA